jgi:hypothetical protein
MEASTVEPANAAMVQWQKKSKIVKFIKKLATPPREAARGTPVETALSREGQGGGDAPTSVNPLTGSPVERPQQDFTHPGATLDYVEHDSNQGAWLRSPSLKSLPRGDDPSDVGGADFDNMGNRASYAFAKSQPELPRENPFRAKIEDWRSSASSRSDGTGTRLAKPLPKSPSQVPLPESPEKSPTKTPASRRAFSPVGSDMLMEGRDLFSQYKPSSQRSYQASFQGLSSRTTSLSQI